MSAPSSYVQRLQARTVSGVDIGRYSRLVGSLRVALPLIALGLLVMVVVWPQWKPRDAGFRLTLFQGVSDSAEASRMLNARFVGTDQQGQPITVTADSATRDADAPEVVVLDRPAADLMLKDGSWVALSAAIGRYRRSENMLSLDGDVALFSDAGYEFHTAAADVDLHAGTASSGLPVQGQGTLGLLRAQGFHLDRAKGSIHFTGPVALTIYPATKPAPRAAE